MPQSLPDSTHLGYVALTVSDLSRSVDFYTRHVGLHLRDRTATTARLGTSRRGFLELHEVAGATYIPRRTGLYHFAILVPTRLELAFALRNLIETSTQIQGFADHIVSEAIYLPDPDGNGIEIYCDRSRSNWYNPIGELQLDTLPLDVENLLIELNDQPREWAGVGTDTTLGHVHLHVNRLPINEQFYRDVIGFDLMMRYGNSAAFMSAARYHHHLGINTWAGHNAPPKPEGTVGLRWWELILPSDAVEAVAARAKASGEAITPLDNGYELRDPSQNAVRVVTEPFERV